MFRTALRGFLFCLLMAAMPGLSPAQSFVLDLPRQSQRAQVSQRVGITDITISYHRPLVNDRKVWDALAPMARCGARERMKTRRSRSAIRSRSKASRSKKELTVCI